MPLLARAGRSRYKRTARGLFELQVGAAHRLVCPELSAGRGCTRLPPRRCSGTGAVCAQGLTEPQHWHHLAEACAARCSELVQDATQGQPGPSTIACIDRISDEVGPVSSKLFAGSSVSGWVLRAQAVTPSRTGQYADLAP